MARLPIEAHPGFQAEWEHERAYYGQRSGRVLRKLDQEMDRGVELIAIDPLRFNAQGPYTRGYRLPSFPISIIYRVLPDRIQLIAFAHAKRRSQYWKNRLR